MLPDTKKLKELLLRKVFLSKQMKHKTHFVYKKKKKSVFYRESVIEPRGKTCALSPIDKIREI